MNKELIHNRFAKNISSYNENAKIQKKMANKLITFLTRKNYKKILEIGCGTGFLTEIANQCLEFDSYKTIDIVKECESYIANINPKIEFSNIDIESFIENDTNRYDLIISNATLQWIENFKETIDKIYSRLNKDGEFIFSTFGNENFREIFQVTGLTLNYYSIEELKGCFPKAEFYSEMHIMAFNSPKDVLKHLKFTGVNAIEQKIWTKKNLQEFETKYRVLYPNKQTLTYNPIYIKTVK